MTFGISPWLMSCETPFLMAPSLFSPVMGLPLDCYFSASTVGSWQTPWCYQPGWANRFCSQASNYLSAQQQAGGYPPAVADRSVDYIRSALGGNWMPQFNRYATAYDAYSAYQHASIAQSGRKASDNEKIVWSIADGLTSWMDKQQRRKDYDVALGKIMASGGDANNKMANLLIPGSEKVTDAVITAAGQYLQASERKGTAEDIRTLIMNMGGVAVVENMTNETLSWARNRGV